MIFDGNKIYILIFRVVLVDFIKMRAYYSGDHKVLIGSCKEGSDTSLSCHSLGVYSEPVECTEEWV